jgi:hypothetical protein
MLPGTSDYQVRVADDVNGTGAVLYGLISEKVAMDPRAAHVARAIGRPVTVRNMDDGAEATVVPGRTATRVINGPAVDPVVRVEATVDQLLDLSQLEMRRGGLWPIGLFTARGARILLQIATGKLRVHGLFRHPFTVFRFIALVSVAD